MKHVRLFLMVGCLFRVDSNPRNDGSGLVDNTITIGDEPLRMTYRIVEWNKDKSALVEILKDQTDPSLYHGDDYYMAMGVEPAKGGCFLTLSHELTHNNFGGRISLAAGAAAGGRRIKHLVEARNGRAQSDQGGWENIYSGLVTGVLTFASFALLFDWSFAALLIGVVFVHELGHVIAMKWCGMPVRGIYFLPFLGAVAVSKTGWRSEAERGFVALMGPGFSVIPTAILLYFLESNASPIIYHIILISAFLNALNLVPVLPLDGGHVFGALTSRFDDDVRRIIETVFLFMGIGAAVYLRRGYSHRSPSCICSLFGVPNKDQWTSPSILATAYGSSWLTREQLYFISVFGCKLLHRACEQSASRRVWTKDAKTSPGGHDLVGYDHLKRS